MIDKFISQPFTDIGLKKKFCLPGQVAGIPGQVIS